MTNVEIPRIQKPVSPFKLKFQFRIGIKDDMKMRSLNLNTSKVRIEKKSDIKI